ncbi:MAG: SpoIIE family protein phosphatase [Leptospiraceae bacterium]|nr:SpoIIE family protein phosphatase [Leptospiraceae bacterium]
MRRIKNKMMLSILPSMAVLLILLAITIAYYIYKSEQVNLLNRNLLTAKSYASQIDAFINRYSSIGETLSYSQVNYGSHSREEVSNLLKQITEKDKNILGSWVIYEPNAFDNKDFQNKNKLGHDSTGRFLPYWNRLKGDLLLEPVLDVDTSDFYIVPKNTKGVFIPTPFIYEGVLMMSFCYPIIKDKVFKGVAGLDISIETVKNLLKGFEENKIYKSNYALLVSDTGILISSSIPLFDDYILNKKTISQIATELSLSEYEDLAKEIFQRKEGYIKTKDPFTKEDVIAFYSPIKTGNLSIIVSISKSDLLANTLNAIYILICIGIISLIIIGTILYYLINTIIDPLNQLTDTVTEFGKQNFSKRSTIATNDEIGELAQNFNSMANSIQEYSNDMEKKIQKRTIELNSSLEQVTKLKFQQDGDYFLTSLLLKPFFKKNDSSRKFQLDFLIEQKKTFEFKRKQLSIGGDLCYTDNIFLNGKSYIVFLNGDAMGKSLQGAGGALILGSIFGTNIERNKSNNSLQSLSPERWLKNTFIDLHKTFETFDGLMLVSITMGLIEEETDVMYYINAEHPFTILFRDNYASFIEEEISLRKLGTPDLDGKLSIKTFKLKPNDVIFIGSDGKDDLVLNSGSTNARIINNDESLFLRIIEETEGDLKKIKEHLSKYGELMDDLSILRIEYIGQNVHETMQDRLTVANRQEAIELLETMRETNPRVLKHLAKLYLQEKDYEKAYSRVIEYISTDSSNTEVFYLASFVSLKLNRLSQSLGYIERCILRDPKNEKYSKLHSKIKEKLQIITNIERRKI